MNIENLKTYKESESTILIVDNNVDTVEVLFTHLNNSGFKVLVAQDGKSAIEQIEYAQPDIILLDVRMPGIDGFETCRRLKENEATKDIPIIFMTVLTDTKDKVKGFEVGAVDYITKPFQYEEVLARVTTHLTLRNLQKKLEDQMVQLQQEVAERKRAEEALQKAKNELEIRVQERTAKLSKINAILGEQIVERKRAEEQLRNLSRHLQSVLEEERIRISREIHDNLKQPLAGLKIDLSWLEGRLPEDQKSLLERTQSMSKLIDTINETMLRICTELRPSELDHLGLTAAVEGYVQDFQNRWEIKCKFISSPEVITLDKDRSAAVFRIFQETMINIARHADATRVDISLKEKVGNLLLKVKDNGKGISKSKISDPRSLGLIGMRERALRWGGEVKIKGSQGKGTTVTVRIPLDKSKEIGGAV